MFLLSVLGKYTDAENRGRCAENPRATEQHGLFLSSGTGTVTTVNSDSRHGNVRDGENDRRRGLTDSLDGYLASRRRNLACSLPCWRKNKGTPHVAITV